MKSILILQEAFACKFGWRSATANPESIQIANDNNLSEIRATTESLCQRTGQGTVADVVASAFEMVVGQLSGEMPRTWDKVGNEAEFVTAKGDRLFIEPIPDGDDLDPHGEYPRVLVKASAGMVEIKRKGIILVMPFEAIFNDDAGAINQILKQAAARTVAWEEREYYSQLMNPDTLPSGSAFYGGDNVIASNALSSDGLAAATVKLCNQRDSDGNLMHLKPKALVVPPKLESTAKELLEKEAAFPEPDRIQLVTSACLEDARLTGYSNSTWYLTADKNQIDGIVMGFVKGYRQPQVKRQTNFASDALEIKVTHACQAAPVMAQGVIKCTA